MESEFSPEVLELSQRMYDENRHYIPIAPGMVNQIYRNGQKDDRWRWLYTNA